MTAPTPPLRRLREGIGSFVTVAMAAALRAGAVRGRYREAGRIARFAGPHISAAQIIAALDDSSASTYITKSGTSYTLTDAGLAYARKHPNPR